MKLKAIFEGQKNDTNAYDLVVGSVFKEELNETLDSGSILVSNVEEERKLELEPYQYVYIFSEDNSFEKYMLIDNFIENYVNLDKPFFEYQVALMSETKLLEKIQLPNRTIRNALNNNLLIKDIMRQFLNFYIPQVKFYSSDSNSWSYKRLIDFEDVCSNEKFNVPCPDMEFNNPTLRQVITALMQVVGCLPIIKNRVLGFIDLRTTPTEFIVPSNKKYYISTSNSSDSYVSSIQTLATNVVGNDNIVKNEMIGFRDIESAVLKHTENLKLTTQMPIKEIEELIMNVAVNTMFPIYLTRDPSYRGVSTYNGILVKDNKITFRLIFDKQVTIKSARYVFQNITTQTNDSNPAPIVKVNAKSDIIHNNSTTVSYNETLLEYEYVPPFIANNNYNYVFIELLTDNGYSYYYLSLPTELMVELRVLAPRILSADITSLVNETQKRKLLRTDLTYTPLTLEEMSSYYYTTVEYTYGANTIEGFSQNYSYVKWYGSYTENFISGLLSVVINEVKNVKNYEVNVFEKYVGFLPYDRTKCYINEKYATSEAVEINELSPFALITFNITYIPFNNVNFKFDKNKDIPFSICQLDNQESSIPSLKSFSSREQEKVNRVGNNVLKIAGQNITDLSEINSLNTKYKDNIIFSKEMAVYEDFVNVNYIATKDYVLKNYFTNIQTKYRAYQYVDYKNTTLRIENKKYYIYLARNTFNGSDTLVLGNFSQNEDRQTLINDYFLSNLVGGKNIFEILDYNVKGTYEGVYFKNDLSIVSFNNNVALSYKDFDSVSGGVYIDTGKLETKVGGYTQSWYIRNDYDTFNQTLFIDYTFLENQENINYYIFGSESEIQDYLYRTMKMPRIRDNDFNPNNFKGKMLYIVDYRESNFSFEKFNRAFYKSQDEVLSETIQFEFVSGESELEMGLHFLDYKTLISEAKIGYIEYDNKPINDYEMLYETNTSNIKHDIKQNEKKGIIIPTTKNYFNLVAYNASNYIILASGTKAVATINASISDTKSTKCYGLLNSDREKIYKCYKNVSFNNKEKRECIE